MIVSGFDYDPELSNIRVGVKYALDGCRADDKVIFNNHVTGLKGEITGVRETSIGDGYLEFCCVEVKNADY